MLSHPTRVITGIRRTRAALLLAGAAMVLIALGTRLDSPPAEGAPVPAGVSTGTVPSAPAATAGARCWVTGDLVGEGNPAELAVRPCGRNQASARGTTLPQATPLPPSTATRERRHSPC